MISLDSPWKKRIVVGNDWVWINGKLWHKCAPKNLSQTNPVGCTALFVSLIYADQNRSRAVRRSLEKLLDDLPSDGVAINIGAGTTQYRNVVNIEIADGPTVHIVGFGPTLPFQDSSVDLAIAQEVLEHVENYNDLVDEVYRVLKPGGRFYCQVPFQIGFHPGPCDYWRFTRQGLEQMFSPPLWQQDSISITLGHGSGFYRIAVEFIAVTASCISQGFYRPSKAIFALTLYPLKWFDYITNLSKERDRIAGGYLCIAKKI